MSADLDTGIKIMHPDGSFSVFEQVPQNSIEVFRYLSDQDRIANRV